MARWVRDMVLGCLFVFALAGGMERVDGSEKPDMKTTGPGAKQTSPGETTKKTPSDKEEKDKPAPPKSFWEWDHLSSDWGGWRSKLEDRGLTFGLVYKGEGAFITRRGIKRGETYLDNLDISMEVDAEKAVGWTGATFFGYFVVNSGEEPSVDYIGDFQTASNIEAPNTGVLQELWYQQNLFDDHLSILVGMLDVNSEFDVNATALVFLHSSPGIGPEFSQAGTNGPSTFPATGFAARVRVHPDQKKQTYIQAAIFEGEPGDPNKTKRTQIDWDTEEGVMIVGEMGYISRPYDEEKPRTRYLKAAVGGWHFTDKYQDVLRTDGSGNSIQRRGNEGFYVLLEGMLFPEEDDVRQGLSAYFRYGVANEQVNNFEQFLGVGFVYTGLLPGRDEDHFGVSVNILYTSNDLQQARRRAGTPVEDFELALTVTYQLRITPFFTIQPSFQYIANPSASRQIPHANVILLRFTLDI